MLCSLLMQAGCLLGLEKVQGLAKLVLPPPTEEVVVVPFADGQDLRCVVEGRVEWVTLTDWEDATETYTLNIARFGHKSGRSEDNPNGSGCLVASQLSRRPLPTRYEIAPMPIQACRASLDRVEHLTFGQEDVTGSGQPIIA